MIYALKKIFLKTEIKNSVLIDGDDIRKHISFDLGYSIKDREIQITRILGLAKVIQKSKLVPIISTVYFNKKILKETKKIGIVVRMINRDISKIMKTHPTYKNKKNVVGKDIKLKNINTKIIENISKEKFIKELNKLIR